MPWKNGGGETVEVVISPKGADLASFDWRISMARVAADGPFSQFPGVDRSRAILEGKGIALSVEGAPPVYILKDAQPHFFPGDAVATASLLSGVVTDFNVMSRRATCGHKVSILEFENEYFFHSLDNQRVIFALTPIEVVYSDHAFRPYDCLFMERQEECKCLANNGPARAIVCELFEVN